MTVLNLVGTYNTDLLLGTSTPGRKADPDPAALIYMQSYCAALGADCYPTHKLTWDLARLDTGTVVIHVFDPGAGLHVRTFQPYADGWELLAADDDDALVDSNVDLRRLIVQAASDHLTAAPGKQFVH